MWPRSLYDFPIFLDGLGKYIQDIQDIQFRIFFGLPSVHLVFLFK